MASTYYRPWLAEPEGWFPVGVLNPDLQEAIKAKEKVVSLSADTMRKQRERHPELTPEEYQQLPGMIEQGEVIQDGERTLVLLRDAGRVYLAAVKTTGTDKGLFLLSFRRLSSDAGARDREIRRFLDRSRELRKERN